jgi:hypothetical protein
VKAPVLSPEVLDGLRLVADPELPTAGMPSVSGNVPAYQPGSHGAGVLPAQVGAAANAAESDANDYLRYVHATYGADVEDMIRRARELFVRYGDEISAALLLSALPESYAAEWGAPVLIAHGDLVWQLPRRIRQTALFLLAVLTDTDTRVTEPGPAPATAAPGLRSANRPPVINTASTLFQQCVWLRLFHASIRRDLGGDATAAPGIPRRNTGPSVPLNQEDLLATLLTFSVTTFRVLEAFGIALDDADREAYVFLWNLVGACLGVGTPASGAALAFLAAWNGDRTFAASVPTGWLLPATVGSAERIASGSACRARSTPGGRSPGPTWCPAGCS